MKKFQTDQLINALKDDVQKLLACVAFFKQHKEALLKQPAEGQWSAAQVLEHLNRYGRFYLPHINKALTTSENKEREAWFTAGFLGDYFTKMLKPTNIFEIKNKVKTQKNYAPDNNLKPDAVLQEFTDQQNELLQLLELAKTRSLNNIRIPISITKLVKLKLGDTFRFFIAHEQRHMIQARNAVHAAGVPTDKFPVILQAIAQ